MSLLARCTLDLVGVLEVRYDKGDTVRAGDYIFFFMEKESKIINWEWVVFYRTQEIRFC